MIIFLQKNIFLAYRLTLHLSQVLFSIGIVYSGAENQPKDHQKINANKSSINQFVFDYLFVCLYHKTYLMLLYKVLHKTLESHMNQSVSLAFGIFRGVIA